MNNKGFTLVELIVVIVLIALIGTVVVINIVGMQSDEDSMTEERFEQRLAMSGCTYIDMLENIDIRTTWKNDGADHRVSIGTLIDKGLIDGDSIDPKTNKKLSEESSSLSIKIKWINDGSYKKKTCTFERG